MICAGVGGVRVVLGLFSLFNQLALFKITPLYSADVGFDPNIIQQD